MIDEFMQYESFHTIYETDTALQECSAGFEICLNLVEYYKSSLSSANTLLLSDLPYNEEGFEDGDQTDQRCDSARSNGVGGD